MGWDFLAVLFRGAREARRNSCVNSRPTFIVDPCTEFSVCPGFPRGSRPGRIPRQPSPGELRASPRQPFPIPCARTAETSTTPDARRGTPCPCPGAPLPRSLPQARTKCFGVSNQIFRKPILMHKAVLVVTKSAQQVQ